MKLFLRFQLVALLSCSVYGCSTMHNVDFKRSSIEDISKDMQIKHAMTNMSPYEKVRYLLENGYRENIIDNQFKNYDYKKPLIMILVKMIYCSGPDDFECNFYKNNTVEAHKNFLDRMLKEATQDLKDYLRENDVDDFLLNTYQEQVYELNRIKDDFITNGRARFDNCVSLCVGERLLKDILEWI